MKALIDTNVLVMASVSETSGHKACLAFIERLLKSRSPWCLSWVNIYEFIRVVTHSKVFSKPVRWNQAVRQMSDMIRHPALQLLVETDRHVDVMEQVIKEAGGASGNFVHDCHIAALMVEHDVYRIVTADADFRRFPMLEVVAPEDA